LSCPICQKRKAKRFCPAKAENICSVCCGTEREVTIDCPSDCTYLIASRRNEQEHRAIDWSKVPFAETKIPTSFVAAHQKLILAISYGICAYARDNRPLVDPDAVESLQTLAEAYRTLSSGLYYEEPPDYLLQRELYERIKAAIEEYKKDQAREPQVEPIRDSDIRDTLIFLTQLGTIRANGRSRGRAFLDFLRSQFKPEEFSKPATSLLVMP
jgi:hypothetical protein